MLLDMEYNFKGFHNTVLKIEEIGDGYDLITERRELISSITTGYGLMRVLQDLLDGTIK